jgi:hypothetical protein
MLSVAIVKIIDVHHVSSKQLIAPLASAHKTKISHAICHNVCVLTISSIWQTKQIANHVPYPA